MKLKSIEFSAGNEKYIQMAKKIADEFDPKIAIIKDRKDVVKLYRGILGKAKVEELKEFEEEALM